MKCFSLFSFVAVISILISGCTDSDPQTSKEPTVTTPFLARAWSGPYGGVPPWDKVRPSEFVAAFDFAIAEAKRDYDAIASNSAAPTFENTIVALEKAGSTLSRLRSIFGVHDSNLNVGPIPEIKKNIDPKLSKFSDSVVQNALLFARIKMVYHTAKNLDPAQKRLLETTYKSYVRQGADLNKEDKAKLSEINTKLTKLQSQFSENVQADQDGLVTWIDDASQLGGLSEGLKTGYAKAAKDLGQPGKWAVRNTRSAMAPFLTYSSNRALREKVWRTYISRGDNGGANDNNAIISEILKLRAERAALLGYETHAHLQLEPRMAATPEGATKLMMAVWPKAVKRVAEEVADMQKIADAEGGGITIEAWDYRYYAEKVRQAKYDLDSNKVREYLQLEKMVEAMLWVSEKVFGLKFTQIQDVSVFHPDVRVYKVENRDGGLVGLWYLDPFARDGKRDGAWMTTYRSQQNIDGWITPIVSNNSNFVKSGDGAVFISWTDAETLFHEFGHALHGLLSNVTYVSQSGTRVVRDYVEFPSQLIEHWLSTKAVLSKYAVNAAGEPMPEELVKKIENAAKFNQGFKTVEYLASALIDMKLHLHKKGDAPIDTKKFEKVELDKLGMPKQIVMRHRIPQFLHLFSYGYSAGYYSYLWSDALTADSAELFEEQKDGYYDKATAESLIKNIFSVGDTIDPSEGFRRFRGRDVDTGALLRKRGFPEN